MKHPESKAGANPFRIQGVVEPPFFTDRADEVARIRAALQEPGAKLLVYGERRMGKTSALLMAARAAERKGTRVVVADFSTASSVTDLANRILEGAARALGRRKRDAVGDLVERLQLRLQLIPDPTTGLMIPTLEAALRSRDVEEQRASLARVLDTLEELAADRGVHLGLVLDEFQEIHRFGGEEAEWHLRGVLQRHAHVSYVCAGSATHLIRRMLGRERAFYKLFDVLSLGAIDEAHLARWIDERVRDGGRPLPGLGSRCIAAAGPRTRDVVQLARRAWEVATRDPALDAEGAVRRAFGEIVAEDDDLARTLWDNLTPLQQNVLRAVAGAEEGLTAQATLERFGLGPSGSAANAARRLAEEGYLTKPAGRGSGFAFDSPFLRGWVVVNALPDLGLHVDPLEGGGGGG